MVLAIASRRAARYLEIHLRPLSLAVLLSFHFTSSSVIGRLLFHRQYPTLQKESGLSGLAIAVSVRGNGSRVVQKGDTRD
jgi:uncharacterized membrane protein